jgi:hypothetical protein
VNRARRRLPSGRASLARAGEFFSRSIRRALSHGLRALVSLLGATEALWVGGVRERGHPDDDELHGWRPRAMKYLRFSEERDRRVTALLRGLHANDVDPMTQANVALAGTTRALPRREPVADDEWRESWLYK